MSKDALAVPACTIGLDLGDRLSAICVLDARGDVVAQRTLPTTAAALTTLLATYPACRVVLEVGTHSPWISRHLTTLGAEVFVANPSAMYGARRRRRNDRMDAEFLARQGRADPTLLHAITHRSATAQAQLETLRARDQLVQVRTKLINHVRGTVKALGARLPAASADAFVRKVAGDVPAVVHDAVAPLLETIARLTDSIHAYDAQVQTAIRTTYPAAQQLQQVAGVGAITALTYVLLVEDPTRFAKSRDVGAYFGLVPRLDESSRATPQLRITKAGDPLARRLLVSAAHYILGPFGPPCDLRRHGEALAARGGPNAKKRAVVAVARKLAVLLHRLWVTGATYVPDYTVRTA
ncbi:MAG: IS110 family transposase [Gemmatimonadota bacterium]